MENRFPHQTVDLIACMQPQDAKIPTPEDLLTYIARVSNPSNQENWNTAPKLLKHCMDEKHVSVFDQGEMTLEVQTTLDIAMQIIRHQFKIQQFSQRYAKADLGFVFREARLQDKKNRQNSLDEASEDLKLWWKNKQQDIQDLILPIYSEALNRGIAKEQARSILPFGNTLTRLYLKNSVRGWFFYCLTRTHVSTQLEHRDLAEKCKAHLLGVYPALEYAFENTDAKIIERLRQENDALKKKIEALGGMA